MDCTIDELEAEVTRKTELQEKVKKDRLEAEKKLELTHTRVAKAEGELDLLREINKNLKYSAEIIKTESEEQKLNPVLQKEAAKLQRQIKEKKEATGQV